MTGMVTWMARCNIDILIFPGGSRPNVLCKSSTAAQWECGTLPSKAVFCLWISLLIWSRHLLPLQKNMVNISNIVNSVSIFSCKSPYLGIAEILCFLLCKSILIEKDLNEMFKFLYKIFMEKLIFVSCYYCYGNCCDACWWDGRQDKKKKKKAKPCKRNLSASEWIKQLDGRSVWCVGFCVLAG